jgi:glycosyltransferase involved in cell wall biosynthesis
MDFFIVTPSFNQKKFLEQTIKSVISQSTKGELHYWVFDGGSTDGSRQLLKKYDKQLNWQSKKDKGQTDAINKGIKELKKWLKKTKRDPEQVVFAYLNSDDYYLPNAFSLVEKFFPRTNAKWLVSDCLIVDERGKEIQPLVRFYKQWWRFWLSKGLLGVLNPIPQPGVFIRASEILKIGFFDESLRYTMDYDYWFKLFSQSGMPLRVSSVLAAFRIHGLSKGGKEFLPQFKEQYQVTQRYIKNRVILNLQRLHTAITIAFYRLIK